MGADPRLGVGKAVVFVEDASYTHSSKLPAQSHTPSVRQSAGQRPTATRRHFPTSHDSAIRECGQTRARAAQENPRARFLQLSNLRLDCYLRATGSAWEVESYLALSDETPRW